MMKRALSRVHEILAPAAVFVRLTGYLFEVRRDTELRPILRSYLGWVPLCLFSEPFVWVRMLLGSRCRFLRKDQQPHSFYVPYLRATPFGKPDHVSKFLEESFAAISEEFARVAPPEIGTPSQVLVSDGVWNTFPLMRSGKKFQENIDRCPGTWVAAEQCPLMQGVRGGVYFSIIYPGTHLRSHCGPSNLKLRYHLTLEEAEGVKIRSGKEWRSWHRGECLILDDSFEHEVLHNGDKRRVVLIVDCWHPDLTEKDRAFLTRLHQIWRGS
jgi:Aspartyl/Asparaginyl beta-hydroxylase